MPKAPALAAAPGLPSYTAGDAAVDISNVVHLIETMLDIAHEMPHPPSDPEICRDLTRINAFGHISVEALKRIADDLANMPEEMRS